MAFRCTPNNEGVIINGYGYEFIYNPTTHNMIHMPSNNTVSIIKRATGAHEVIDQPVIDFKHSDGTDMPLTGTPFESLNRYLHSYSEYAEATKIVLTATGDINIDARLYELSPTSPSDAFTLDAVAASSVQVRIKHATGATELIVKTGNNDLVFGEWCNGGLFTIEQAGTEWVVKDEIGTEVARGT